MILTLTTTIEICFCSERRGPFLWLVALKVKLQHLLKF